MLDALLSFLINVVVTGIFYWPGRIILKMLTLGHYPPARDAEHNQELVALIGMIALAASAISVHLLLTT